jgi:hypothetical protein
MELQQPVTPIVIDIKKKKKRRYSRGLGDIQRSVRRMSKISTRAAKAYYKGIDGFYTASDKSSLKKKDGALRDFNKNFGKAASKSLKAASRIPADFGKILNTRSTRRVIRRQIRIASLINKRFGAR